MGNEFEREEAAAVMRQINQAWLDGQVKELFPLVHPQIVAVFPGFLQRIQGRDEFLAGFSDFCQNATIQEFHEHDHQVDLVGDTAVVNFRFEMVYERSGKRNRSTGRDLWVFQKQNSAWTAVWRTILDMEECPA